MLIEPSDTLESMANKQPLANKHRAYLEIDLDRIKHNFHAIRTLCPGKKIMPILKGDAYGIGAVALARMLVAEGADAVGVDNVGEACILRNAGIEIPLLVLDACVAENVELALDLNLIPGIATETLLKAYDDAASKKNIIAPVWLYFNSGFNRSGYRDPEAFSNFVTAAAQCKNLRVECVYAHLTDSHDDEGFTQAQIAEFNAAIKIVKNIFSYEVATSLLASHGILRYGKEAPYDWVRPGIILYGEHCLTGTADFGDTQANAQTLQPALSLQARVLHRVYIHRDQYFGYGKARPIRAGSVLGTVAAGFGSGLPQNGRTTKVASNGKLFSTTGVVGMDYLQIVLDSTDDLQEGEWVTLFGDQEKGAISLSEMCADLNISPYVLIRNLNVYRHYLKEE